MRLAPDPRVTILEQPGGARYLLLATNPEREEKKQMVSILFFPVSGHNNTQTVPRVTSLLVFYNIFRVFETLSLGRAHRTPTPDYYTVTSSTHFNWAASV